MTEIALYRHANDYLHECLAVDGALAADAEPIEVTSYEYTESLRANTEKLCVELGKVAQHKLFGKSLARLAGRALTGLVVTPSPDMSDRSLVQSPLFDTLSEKRAGVTLRSGWRMVFTMNSREDKRNYGKFMYPYSNIRLMRSAEASDSRFSHERSSTALYTLAPNEIDQRLVRSEEAAQDIQLAAQLRAGRKSGNPVELGLLNRALKTELSQDSVDEWPVLPRIEDYLPTASTQAAARCYYLTDLALQEFGLK